MRFICFLSDIGEAVWQLFVAGVGTPPNRRICLISLEGLYSINNVVERVFNPLKALVSLLSVLVEFRRCPFDLSRGRIDGLWVTAASP